MTAQMKKQLEGWFATSFWVDLHYMLAALGTVVVLVMYILTQKFDVGFASFVSGMWVTAVGNDKMNMPPAGSA